LTGDEVIADMCASGSWSESYQIRRFFGMRAGIDLAFVLWQSGRVRASQPIPRWVLLFVAAGVLASLGVKFTYDNQIRRFWNEIRDDWFAHERMLDEDPRNGQPG
jgi:hypothetical protein